MIDTSTLGAPRADDLARRGWTHGRLTAERDEGWRRFSSAWDDLVPDRYVGAEQCHRDRRYGRVLAHRDGTLEPLRGTGFFQSTEINRSFGGRVRVFEPLTDGFTADPEFHRLLLASVAVVTEVEGPRDWELGIHLIRVTAHPGRVSKPAPEGRHSDGHAFVSIHLVGRHRCAGGVSEIFRRGAAEADYTVTMTEPLEVLVLRDTATEHAVSEIRSAGPDAPGRRDTMIIDLNRVPDVAEVAGRTYDTLQVLEAR